MAELPDNANEFDHGAMASKLDVLFKELDTLQSEMVEPASPVVADGPGDTARASAEGEVDSPASLDDVLAAAAVDADAEVDAELELDGAFADPQDVEASPASVASDAVAQPETGAMPDAGKADDAESLTSPVTFRGEGDVDEDDENESDHAFDELLMEADFAAPEDLLEIMDTPPVTRAASNQPVGDDGEVIERDAPNDDLLAGEIDSALADVDELMGAFESVDDVSTTGNEGGRAPDGVSADDFDDADTADEVPAEVNGADGEALAITSAVMADLQDAVNQENASIRESEGEPAGEMPDDDASLATAEQPELESASMSDDDVAVAEAPVKNDAEDLSDTDSVEDFGEDVAMMAAPEEVESDADLDASLAAESGTESVNGAARESGANAEASPESQDAGDVLADQIQEMLDEARAAETAAEVKSEVVSIDEIDRLLADEADDAVMGDFETAQDLLDDVGSDAGGTFDAEIDEPAVAMSSANANDDERESSPSFEAVDAAAPGPAANGMSAGALSDDLSQDGAPDSLDDQRTLAGQGRLAGLLAMCLAWLSMSPELLQSICQTISKPFNRIPPEIRDGVGYAGLATVAMGFLLLAYGLIT